MNDGATIKPVRLSELELTAWRNFLRAHARVTRLLEADLLAAHQMPLSWYDVMVQLVEAPGRRLRMTDLADSVLISRSGLSRLVDRMQAEGLVDRIPAPTDARGYFCVLTPQGFERLRDASSTHLQGVRSYATSRLDPAELPDAARIFGKLAQ